jgi:hypothetical protein
LREDQNEERDLTRDDRVRLTDGLFEYLRNERDCFVAVNRSRFNVKRFTNRFSYEIYVSGWVTDGSGESVRQDLLHFTCPRNRSEYDVKLAFIDEWIAADVDGGWLRNVEEMREKAFGDVYGTASSCEELDIMLTARGTE